MAKGNKKTINWKKVDNYLRAQCSGVGIASLLGIHENTLYERCKEEKGMAFVEYSTQKKGEGKELLRAKQFATAMEGEKAMLIWLGKQYLDQRDKKDLDVSGKLSVLDLLDEDEEDENKEDDKAT
jgi:hypothetical protein